jgi:uncharacterized damage-inducible protein DinB
MDRWFARTFELGLPVSAAPSLIARLERTPGRLEQAVRPLREGIRTHRPGGRWSIQENAGHLLDLEPLWAGRLDDFERGASVLRPADLQNRKTHEAHHNDRPLENILAAFRLAREPLVARLQAMSVAALGRVAQHPRLQQNMSIVDHCVFVAEHDDHHLATIEAIARALEAMPEYALELLETVTRGEAALRALDDEASQRRPEPGKWSPREIVGHLVDSASNNHQRFIRGAVDGTLVFTGYAQDAWVAAQQYQSASWPELVTLWASFNRHLAHVMASIPEPVRRAGHTAHNLNEITFEQPAPGDAATLEYLMRDYVRHLQHHLQQIPSAR